jgi:hemolysin activation/secretion protein
VLSGSYLFRVPNSNLAILASYLNSNSNVATVGGTGVIGKGTVMGLRLQVPLGTDGPFTHSLSLGLDYKSFRDTVLLGADSTVTPVTYVPLVAQYQASWQNEANETLLSGSVVLGTRGLGSNAQAFDQKRYLAQPNFSYVRGDVARRDDLPWGLESSVHASGQATGVPLISNEQYSIGGIDTVRGYLEAEALGDYGGSVQVELRGPLVSDWAPGLASDARPFVFADGGQVAIRNPLPSQRRTFSLASTGAGVRVHLMENFSVDLAAGHVLVAGPNTPYGTTRFLFRVNGAF